MRGRRRGVGARRGESARSASGSARPVHGLEDRAGKALSSGPILAVSMEPIPGGPTVWLALDRDEGPLHQQALPRARGADPRRDAAPGRAPAGHAHARPRARPRAQHRARRLRAARGRGLRRRAHGLGHRASRRCCPSERRARGRLRAARPRAAARGRGRAGPARSRSTRRASSRRRRARVVAWGMPRRHLPYDFRYGEPAYARPPARDLVPPARPPRAPRERGAARLRRARRLARAAPRARRLPAPRARRRLHARADPDHARHAAGDRPRARACSSTRASASRSRSRTTPASRSPSARTAPSSCRSRVDDDGLRVEELERERGRCAASASTPSHQFPTGGCCRSSGGSRCSPSPSARAPSCSRTTTTASTATRDGRCRASRASTAPAACSTSAPPRSCCSRRCASAGWSCPEPLAARLHAGQGLHRHRQRHARAARARRLHRGRPPGAPRAPLARAQRRAPRGAARGGASATSATPRRSRARRAGLHGLLWVHATCPARARPSCAALRGARRRHLPGAPLLHAPAAPRRLRARLRVARRARDRRGHRARGGGAGGGAGASRPSTRRASPTASDLDLRPELDDAVRREAEELGGGARVAREVGEERLAPGRHLRRAAGEQRLAAEVVGGVVEVDGEALARARRRGGAARSASA